MASMSALILRTVLLGKTNPFLANVVTLTAMKSEPFVLLLHQLQHHLFLLMCNKLPHHLSAFTLFG